MCVDDERIILTSLKDQLRRSFGGNIVVETAESGEEGLDVFQELRDDGTDVPLVIADQLMPGMRGDAFLAKIHEIEPRTLNIMLTGIATADAVGKAVNTAKLYHYIGKPWAEADLVLTVREALRTYAQDRAIELKKEEIRAAHAASLRFVPREFLSLLGRRQVVDVQFGDHVDREMNVLFSDMRGYTRLVEGKTTTEAFEFVNEYMQLMEGPIRKHGGFISNIEGDAILALFPGTADDAVKAGIESHRVLRELNVTRTDASEDPVCMGLAVNTGHLLLGTIGGEERLQCDVVGDPANVCARIENLTKHYETAMLISHATQKRLVEPVAVRLVDRVRAQGKTQPVILFEVLDALPETEALAKLESAGAFGAACEMFRAGQVSAAVDAFEELLEQNPADGAARQYLSRCHTFQKHGLPKGWDGVTTLNKR